MQLRAFERYIPLRRSVISLSDATPCNNKRAFNEVLLIAKSINRIPHYQHKHISLRADNGGGLIMGVKPKVLC